MSRAREASGLKRQMWERELSDEPSAKPNPVTAWLRWRRGRQQTGYDKLLLAGAPWPVPFDLYLLRFRTGTHIPPHRDETPRGRHFRLNVILRPAEVGGQFLCRRALLDTERIKLFRPDLEEHSVTLIERGTRWVLSLGWVLSRH